MKKDKIGLSISVGITCFILFLAIFMQFKAVNQVDIIGIETMRETELRSELATWKAKYSEITEQNNEIYNKIQKYEEDNISDTQKQELMEEELLELNKMLGVTDVYGQGIEITLKEIETADTNIEATDLILIVNALKGSGAEAISINDHRIISMSDIVQINTTTSAFIKVNSQRIIAPYIIKVIGNPTYLESSLIGSGGKAEELKHLGHEVSIIRKDIVEIPKYDKDISNKYIK